MAQLKDLIVYGDTKFLGDVTLDHDPTANLHAATKAYVDAQVGTGTDEKLKVAALTSGTTYLPILAVSTDSGTAATRQIDSNAQAFKYICTPGTSGGSTKGTAQLILGNGISEGYVNSAAGQLTIFGNAMYGVTLKYGAAYSDQTLMLPAPTDSSQTNYLLSKIGSAAVGAADQPVYFDSNGRAVLANKNLWGFSSEHGIFYPNDASTTGNTFKSGSLTVLEYGIKGITGICTSGASLNMLADGRQNLSTSTAAGSTTYVLASTQDIGANGSNIIAANTYYYSTDGLTAQKPTSVDSNGSTLTFASTLNPNSAISKISFANYDSSGMSILCGAGLTNTSACNLLVGLKIYTTGFYNLAVGSLNYTGGTGSAVTGIRNYVNASYTLTTGYGNTNVKDGAFVSGVWHDTTNGPAYLAAVGKYSNITSTSAFVVGNGTSTSARSNAFEVTTTGEAKALSFTENGIPLVTKYAAYTHSHNLGITSGTSSDTSQLTLALGTKYVLAAGGSTYCFTMPTVTTTDTKVSLTSTTTSASYPLALGPTSITSGSAYGEYYNTSFYVNPSTLTMYTPKLVVNNGNTTYDSPLIVKTITSGTGQVAAAFYNNTTTTSSTTWISGMNILAPNMVANTSMSYANFAVYNCGVALSTCNAGNLAFHYSGSGSTANCLSFGLYGHNNILNIVGTDRIGIMNAAPSYTLDVAGTIRTTSGLIIGTNAEIKSIGTGLSINSSGALCADVGSDTKVTQSAITGTSTTTFYPILLAYGTGQTATTTNTANFSANASITPSGDISANKMTSSTTFNYGANAYTQYNATLKAIEFCFA